MLHHCPDPGVDAQAWHSRHWWRAMTLPELRVVLSADTVEIFLISARRHGQHKSLLHHSVHAVPVMAHAMQAHAAVWQTLSEALSSFNFGAVNAVLVLSNQYVRYLVVPWHDAVTTKTERAGYHAHSMQHHFGEQATSWQVMATATRYGESSLLCAIDATLVAQAEAAFKALGLRLSALYPAWMLTVNQALDQMRQHKQPTSGWLLCRESGVLTLGAVHNGQWLSVESQPVVAGKVAWTETLWQMIQRGQWAQPHLVDMTLWVQSQALSVAEQAQLSGIKVHMMDANLSLKEAKHDLFQQRSA